MSDVRPPGGASLSARGRQIDKADNPPAHVAGSKTLAKTAFRCFEI